MLLKGRAAVFAGGPACRASVQRVLNLAFDRLLPALDLATQAHSTQTAQRTHHHRPLISSNTPQLIVPFSFGHSRCPSSSRQQQPWCVALWRAHRGRASSFGGSADNGGQQPGLLVVLLDLLMASCRCLGAWCRGSGQSGAGRAKCSSSTAAHTGRPSTDLLSSSPPPLSSTQRTTHNDVGQAHEEGAWEENATGVVMVAPLRRRSASGAAARAAPPAASAAAVRSRPCAFATTNLPLNTTTLRSLPAPSSCAGRHRRQVRHALRRVAAQADQEDGGQPARALLLRVLRQARGQARRGRHLGLPRVQEGRRGRRVRYEVSARRVGGAWRRVAAADAPFFRCRVRAPGEGGVWQRRWQPAAVDAAQSGGNGGKAANAAWCGGAQQASDRVPLALP